MQKYNSYDLACICSAPINPRQTIITKHDCEMILHHPGRAEYRRNEGPDLESQSKDKESKELRNLLIKHRI